MKSSKLKLIIIASLVGVGILFAGLVFYASQKLNPEELRKIALEQLQIVFPDSEISLGEVGLSFGLSAKVDLASLSIKLKRNSQVVPMVEVEDLEVRIPIWAILTGGGTIETSLSSPKIHYESIEDSNNWLLAMGKEKPNTANQDVQTETQNSSGAQEIAIPLFLASSAINLRVTDLNLTYKIDKNQGDIKLNRFLIKNLNIKDPTAFEIDSVLAFQFDDTQQKIQFQTLVIGEFDLSSYLAKEDLKLKTMIKISQLKAPGLIANVPELLINLQTTISLDGKITSGINGEMAQSKFSFTVDLNNKEVKIENILVDVLLDSVYQLSASKVPGLSFNRSKLAANGSVIMSESGGINPNLNFKLEPALSYSFDNNQLLVSAQGGLLGKTLSLSSLIEAFGGTMRSEVTGELDLNQKDFSLEKLKPFKADIQISDFKFTRPQLNKIIYAKAPPSADQGSGSVAAAAVAAPVFLPRAVINLSIDKFFIEENELLSKAKFIVGNDQIVSEFIDLKYSNGDGKIKHTTKIMPGFDLNNSFSFTMKNLDLGGLNAFLPPSLSELKGKFTGSFQGKVLTIKEKGPEFDIDIDITATEGEIIGLDLSDSINTLVSSLPLLKDQLPAGKAYDFDSNFEYLLFKGKVTQKLYTISTFEFKGIGKKVELKGDGYVGALGTNNQSQINLIAIDHGGKISKALEKNIGTNNLPIRLSGLEMNLKPDLEYTLGRVAKSALKVQVQKQLNDQVKDKVDDKVEEQVERLKEQGLEQLNKLFRRK